MSDLKLDQTTYDLDMANGDLVLTQKSDAIMQHIKQRLWTFFGEWFLDTSVGVPYYQTILVKNPSLENVQAVLRNEILATPGVTELIEFEVDYDNATRVFSVEGQVRVLDEVIDFSEILEI